MLWKRIDSSSAGGYGLCLQWRQCWFVSHWCKGSCPHHSTMKLVLSHQENKCICYQYFSDGWRKNNHLVMTQQIPTQAELLSHNKYQHRLNCYDTTNTNTGWTVMTQQIPTQVELLWRNQYQHRLNCYDTTNTNTGWTVMTQQIPTNTG